MSTKFFIAANAILVTLLVFVITNFYIIRDEFDESKQYTLMLTFPEPELSYNPQVGSQSALGHSRIEEQVDSLVKEGNKLAIFVIDLGINDAVTQKVIADFPPQISLGFSVYSKNLKQLVEQVEKNEVLLNLPISKNEQNASIALDRELTDEENTYRLTTILAQGGIGVYTVTNEELLFRNSFIYGIFEQLAENNMMLSYGGVDKTIQYIAKEKNIPFVTPDIVIEYEFDENLIKDKIKLIDTLFKYKHNVLLVVKPSPIAIEVIQDFLTKKHDFELAKVSSIAD